jgi:hypothetical protein
MPSVRLWGKENYPGKRWRARYATGFNIGEEIRESGRRIPITADARRPKLKKQMKIKGRPLWAALIILEALVYLIFSATISPIGFEGTDILALRSPSSSDTLTATLSLASAVSSGTLNA